MLYEKDLFITGNQKGASSIIHNLANSITIYVYMLLEIHEAHRQSKFP